MNIPDIILKENTRYLINIINSLDKNVPAKEFDEI